MAMPLEKRVRNGLKVVWDRVALTNPETREYGIGFVQEFGYVEGSKPGTGQSVAYNAIDGSGKNREYILIKHAYTSELMWVLSREVSIDHGRDIERREQEEKQKAQEAAAKELSEVSPEAYEEAFRHIVNRMKADPDFVKTFVMEKA